MTARTITVVGAGILGLWQALVLAQHGHKVTLVEASPEPFADAASRWAGAMLAPYCEEEGAEPRVRDLGLEGMALWREAFPGIVSNGTLVVAAARDRSELNRFARATRGHVLIDAEQVAALEPDLGQRFQSGLYYQDEAHMAPREAMAFLLAAVRHAGVDVRLGTTASLSGDGPVIDCRGLAARAELPTLRGVRGERLLIKTNEIKLTRPVRLLHPRYPLYVVPWADGVFMVGATVIESEDPSPVTVRSALELLGLAYALHPAFGEAEIIELGAGLRPSFPDNVPKVVVRGERLFVNGAYRHGFLLAPVLAKAAADYLDRGARLEGIVVDG
ncbi:MAG: FAD-dependent oxidoreductase [Hyphomicrobiaceae bacterium]